MSLWHDSPRIVISVVLLIALILLSVSQFKNPRLRDKRFWFSLLTVTMGMVTFNFFMSPVLFSENLWTSNPSLFEWHVLFPTSYRISLDRQSTLLVLQILFACFLTLNHLPKEAIETDNPYRPGFFGRTIVVLLTSSLVVALLYTPHFVFSNSSYRVLFLMIGSFGPILLLQWSLGYRLFLRNGLRLFSLIALLTTLFISIDWTLLQAGVLRPSPTIQDTMNIHWIGMPLERLLFTFFIGTIAAKAFLILSSLHRQELPIKLGGRPL